MQKSKDSQKKKVFLDQFTVKVPKDISDDEKFVWYLSNLREFNHHSAADFFSKYVSDLKASIEKDSDGI